jgi:hypothetical protein
MSRLEDEAEERQDWKVRGEERAGEKETPLWESGLPRPVTLQALTIVIPLVNPALLFVLWREAASPPAAHAEPGALGGHEGGVAAARGGGRVNAGTWRRLRAGSGTLLAVSISRMTARVIRIVEHMDCEVEERAWLGQYLLMAAD